MDGEPDLQRAVSEPDSLFIASLIKSNKKQCSSASSAASLIHFTSRSPISKYNSLQRSQSVDQLVIKSRAPDISALIWRSPHSVDIFPNDSSSTPSSLSSTSNKGNGSHNESDSLQYSRFDESPPRRASTPNHAYLERIMLSSIPRRREFSEQFRDLAQLHEHSDVPLAKWDDASRLFPKQFGLPPLVAINIWKQVDSDADMMLTEAEYCLAAHLANKYSTTGFSLLASPSHPPTTSRHHSGGAGAASSSRSSSPSSRHRQRPQRHGRRRGHRRRRNGLDVSYLENEEDDSHDLLLSPDSRLLDQADGKHSSWSSSNHSLSINFKEETNPIDEEEEYEDEDDRKGVSDDEIGVQALLPSSSASIHRRRPHGNVDVEGKRIKERGGGRRRRVGGKRTNVGSSSTSSPSSSQKSSSSSPPDEEESLSSGEGDVGDENGITSDGDDSSVSQTTTSPSSSPASTAATRVESICSISPSAKVIDPVEALCKFTHRSKDDITSFSAHRRRRLLVRFVRAAKSTNYTLLRLNNELVGELQELCDQHTNLNAQVRHLSEMGP